MLARCHPAQHARRACLGLRSKPVGRFATRLPLGTLPGHSTSSARIHPLAGKRVEEQRSDPPLAPREGGWKTVALARRREGPTEITGLPQRKPELDCLEPLARLIVLWIRRGKPGSKPKDCSCKPSSPPAASTKRPVRIRKRPYSRNTCTETMHTSRPGSRTIRVCGMAPHVAFRESGRWSGPLPQGRI